MGRPKKPGGPMLKIAMSMEPEQLEKLDRLSEITRVPRAVYLREAIDDLLGKYKKHLKERGTK